MEMKKNSWVIVIAAIILTVAVALYLLFRISTQRQVVITSPIAQEGSVQTQFSGNGLDSQYPDTLSLSRVIRGFMQNNQFLDGGMFYLDTQVNWPEREPLRPILFRLMPTTEYLCWGENFVAADGTSTPYVDTLFMLDDNHKLFAEGQGVLTQEQATNMIQPGTPVILALSKGYVNSELNDVFQIAIIGCQ